MFARIIISILFDFRDLERWQGTEWLLFNVLQLDTTSVLDQSRSHQVGQVSSKLRVVVIQPKAIYDSVQNSSNKACSRKFTSRHLLIASTCQNDFGLTKYRKKFEHLWENLTLILKKEKKEEEMAPCPLLGWQYKFIIS